MGETMAKLVEHNMPHTMSESSVDYLEPRRGSEFTIFGKDYYVNEADQIIEKKKEETDRGLRYNTGKARYDLLPTDAIHELVKVYTYGANKYAPRNWEKGMPYMEVVGCAERHKSAWLMGEKLDKESGLPHLAMWAWNALALLTYELRNVGEDDRPLKGNASG